MAEATLMILNLIYTIFGGRIIPIAPGSWRCVGIPIDFLLGREEG